MQLLGLAALGQQATAEPGVRRQPNVIVILADDQGFGDLASHGNRSVRTPRLDQLAGQSARLDHFYSTPVCATTRASFLTGRSCAETGVWGVHLARDYMRLDETTLAEVFQRAGYATAFMGKWHNGKHEPWLPWNRGFQECWMASLYVHENNTVSHNGRAEPWRGWTSDRLADKAIKYIDARADQPFFLYLSFLAPHEPWHAPAALVKTYQERGLSPALATVFAMIEQMDAGVGRVLDAVDRRGLAGDTIVVYFSDNGPIGESGNLGDLSEAEMALRNPAGLRGAKGNIWENGIRVPAFIRWPGHVKPRVLSDVVHVRDLFPTLLDLTAVPFTAAPERPLDGVTLAPLLSGKVDSLAPRETVMPYWEARWPTHDSGVLTKPAALAAADQVFSVRTPNLKWIQAWGETEIFDLNADPDETHNLISQRPEDAERLSKLAHDWFSKLQREGRAYQQPRFPVGRVLKPLDEVAETRNVGHVPGFSAVRTSGNVVVETHWSVGWNAVGDSQTMLIRVRDGGRYRVEIETENPTPHAALAVESQGQRVQGELTVDPLASLGEISLQPGDAEITVKAVALPEGKSRFMKKLLGVRFVLLDGN